MTCVNTIGSYYCICEVHDLKLEQNSNQRCLSETETEGINSNCQLLNNVLICNCDEGFQLKKQQVHGISTCEGKKIFLLIDI